PIVGRHDPGTYRLVSPVLAAQRPLDEGRRGDDRNLAAMADESGCRANLRPHAALRKLPVSQMLLSRGGIEIRDAPLGRLAVVQQHRIHSGNKDQGVRGELVSQLRRRIVLVDHRVDAVPDGAAPTYRNATTTSGDDHVTGIEQTLNRIDLDEALGLR